MNDAICTTSPAQTDKTVGNSSKIAQKRRRVQTLEKGDTFALDAMWSAFLHAASSSVEESFKPSTNPQISLYSSYYGTLIPNTESGECIVSSGELVQTLDYYPFGALRVDNQAANFDEKRKFTGHEYDDSTGLSYMGARYQNGEEGRFVSQDSVFQAVGSLELKKLTGRDLSKYLVDPQGFNAYSYTRNNPLRLVDENGEWFKEVFTGQQSFSDFQIEVGQATQQLTQDSGAWNFAVNHPYVSGAAVGLLSAPAAHAGLAGTVALGHVTYPGVGLAYSATRAVEGAAYLYLAQNSIRTIPTVFSNLNKVNFENPSFQSVLPAVGRTAYEVAPTFAGEKLGAIADLVNLAKSLVSDLQKQVDKLTSDKK